MKIEYRVRPITRYVVTRFYDGLMPGTKEKPEPYPAAGSDQRGIYDNPATAYQVAYALCRMEHDKSAEPVDSMNFIYPAVPDGVVLLSEDAATTAIHAPPAAADDYAATNA